ncbi:hypothetical protein [Pleomorphomonas sp. PLEO]|uniref:hypothetical protein n=1 Tax=Pleomorphomonas sp. PLEO TaxID=3239306 RepID=UPI00351E8AA9
MLKYLLVAGFLALVGPANAADATTPVHAIMDVATALWSNTDGEVGDYFDEAHIGNFSKNTRSLYTEATKHPAYDTEDGVGSPFDYDPIILGQDGCPLEGLTLQVGKTDGAATDVVVRFKRFACMEDASDEERNAVSELHFRVISEGGRPVIADVVSGEGSDRYSLVEALKEIQAQ